MASKEYYERWLALKKQIYSIVVEDKKIHDFAENYIGLKPQSNAVEVVSRVYAKYVDIYNKLCDIYDQMVQIQRRPYLKNIIDAVTCRILDLKAALEEIEVFEFTYPDNALQQLLMSPVDVQVITPFFYPFEIRQQELQYVVDEIFAGNRLGDPEQTPSGKERAEEERLEEERIAKEEKEAKKMRKISLGEDLDESVQEKSLNPVALELKRKHLEYIRNVNSIQRMERSRIRVKAIIHKKNKDDNLFLELAGLKKPPAREELRRRAGELIECVYRKYMEIKRRHYRDNKVKIELGMVIPAWKLPSAKIQLKKIQEVRRNFRRKYYEDWLKKSIDEKARVMKLREGQIIEDITHEIRQWFEEWYYELKCFDEFPWPGEGGSILIVQGKTFTIEEYLVWKEQEEKRLKKEAGNPKSKQQIKQEKAAIKAEKRKLELDAKLKEKKRIADYKKQRLNPEADPGCYVKIDNSFPPVFEAWQSYENQWRIHDRGDAENDVKKKYIMQLITETAYQDCQLELRPVVDEMMRLELKLLQKALNIDLHHMQEPAPLVKKRKKPKKVRGPRPERIKPAVMFQKLVDEGIIRKYPKVTLEDYWGDRNFAAAELRAIPWTPSFPLHCIGDVREQVRVRCLLALGSTCHGVVKSHLLVGHRHAGKRTLVYALATESNAILIDFSPLNVFNKCLGPKNQKQMFNYAAKIAKIMQPTVILCANADKMFYKKIPNEEKMFDPTRFANDFYKEVIKPIWKEDRILVMGTANEPWLAKPALLHKTFPSTILIPKTDYASISLILNHLLMRYHGVPREFNLNSVAQVLRGYDIHTVRKAVSTVLTAERIGTLYHNPLQPEELVNAVLAMPNATCLDDWDSQIYKDWYQGYSPWGEKYLDYMIMLESQLELMLKKKKKMKKK